MGRDIPPADEPEVLWWGNGAQLARELKAFIESWYGTSADGDVVLEALRDVLYADVSLLPIRPQLGPPPNRGHASPGIATEPGS